MGQGSDYYDGGNSTKPNPDKVGLHIPTRIAPKPGELGSGAAPGDVAPEENAGIPEAPPIPEPLTRRMPIKHKEIENMDTQMDARDVKQREEDRLLGEGIRKMQEEN